MIEIAMVLFPPHLVPQVLFFKNKEKAQEVCDETNKGKISASSSHQAEVFIFPVYEDDEIMIKPIEDNLK